MKHDHPVIEPKAYELMPGCPTLTLKRAEREDILPYHTCAHAVWQKGEIIIEGDEGIAVIRGQNLYDLWRHLQVQDVRSIRCHRSKSSDGVTITSLQWIQKQKD